jgi:predicted branched-subunit amino acid permease
MARHNRSPVSLSFISESAAFRGGMREALGVPAAVLGAGFIGYGALAAEHGYSIAQIVFATFAIWALPGQLVLIEMNAVGASAVAVIAAVVLSGARFLPMTVTLTPTLRDPRYGPAVMYPAIQLLSMTTWAVTMQRGTDLPSAQRVPYFVGLGLACIVVSAVCGMAGHALAGALPPLVRLGFVFLTPLYFLVILVGDVRTRLAAVALACGAVAGPLFHLVSPQWSVMLAGFAGGTLAYYLQRAYGRR